MDRLNRVVGKERRTTFMNTHSDIIHKKKFDLVYATHIYTVTLNAVFS